MSRGSDKRSVATVEKAFRAARGTAIRVRGFPSPASSSIVAVGPLSRAWRWRRGRLRTLPLDILGRQVWSCRGG